MIQKGPFPSQEDLAKAEENLRKCEEVEQLFRALMQVSREMTVNEAKSLRTAADEDLDRLLARLRQLLKEGHKFDNSIVLSNSVGQLYWIR